MTNIALYLYKQHFFFFGIDVVEVRRPQFDMNKSQFIRKSSR